MEQYYSAPYIYILQHILLSSDYNMHGGIVYYIFFIHDLRPDYIFCCVLQCLFVIFLKYELLVVGFARGMGAVISFDNEYFRLKGVTYCTVY